MNNIDRQELIASYGNAYNLLVDTLKDFPQEMWQFRPAPGKWTVHEIIVHITDSEANSFVRCRRFIAEPGSQVMGYDENVWARALDYHQHSTDEALELFRMLRAASYNLIVTLDEHVWSNTVEHSENGTMTMDDWLETYERHIPVHIAQMQRNLAAWEASR